MSTQPPTATSSEAGAAPDPEAGEPQAPLLIVHTGDGKGKSTAAFGMALRAWSRGWSVGVFQFVKSGKWAPGERAAFEALGRDHARTGVGGPVDWQVCGTGFTWSRASGTEEERAAAARSGWAEVRGRLAARVHDFYVLDEFTYPLTKGWLDVGEVTSVLLDGARHGHVVVTGRGCPAELREAADLVTEMVKVRHPYDAGVRAQRGIEW